MAYRIENIGRQFSGKGSKQLEAMLNQAESEGWEFHSVIGVTQATCLGLQRQETYYMVLHRS